MPETEYHIRKIDTCTGESVQLTILLLQVANAAEMVPAGSEDADMLETVHHVRKIDLCTGESFRFTHLLPPSLLPLERLSAAVQISRLEDMLKPNIPR